MSRWKAFLQMVLARLRVFFREPAALFWVYCFPIFMAIGLALAFKNRPPEAPNVDVVRGDSAGLTEEFAAQLRDARINVTVVDENDALYRYRTGKTALFVLLNGKELTFGLDP